MIEALHLGSMLPATLGACCVAGGADRRSPLAWLGMLTMLAAMADTMLMPHPMLPAIGWAATLVALALATAVRGRVARRGAPPIHSARTMGAHRALQAVVMAGMIVLAAGHRATASEPSAGYVGHAGHGVPLIALLAAAALAFAIASAWIAARPRQPLLVRAEAALSAASVALMALPLVL
jgi:hypothetical protein